MLIKWQDSAPNLETSIIMDMVKGECITVQDVKGVLLSNCPSLGDVGNVYDRLLQSSISRIDWEFIDGYLNYHNASGGPTD